jgi:predicted GNAT family acetyltransferase
MTLLIEHFDDITQFGEAVAAYMDVKRAPLNQLYMMVNAMRAGTAKAAYVWCARASINTETCGVVVVQKMAGHQVAWVSELDDNSARAFADAIRRDEISITSLAGPHDSASRFAHALDGSFYERTRLGNHVLDQSARLLPATGLMRRAEIRDLELLAVWHRAFIEECNLVDDTSQIAERIRAALSGNEPPYWIWESGGRPVATATINVRYGMARVGSVYTPPAERQNGYAGAQICRPGRRPRAWNMHFSTPIWRIPSVTGFTARLVIG